ncbi:MAG: hypothetical protein HZY75_11145 [Nocardioidaceae bacterium]|nr:MAG: hypothetical protein HZY75_11145 [Nocardioidaceae bacterium]
MVNTIAPPAVDSETGPEAGPAAPAKRLYRKPTPGGGWWVAVLLIPALLAAAAVYLGRDGLERDLATQARAALGQAGLSGTTAEFSGRIGRLTCRATRTRPRLRPWSPTSPASRR